MKTDIFKQIKSLTRLLIDSGLVTNYNFPENKDGFISWEGFKNISFILKNEPYETVYMECVKETDYNFVLLDGAIVQLQYEFNRDKLVSHILKFYPHPGGEMYQTAPSEYEDAYYGNVLFTEIRDFKSIGFPVRFDFDSDPKKYREFDHSFCHATLGNFDNCR